ncbi:MAG: hypothetical protein ACPL28_07520 [bacterium]
MYFAIFISGLASVISQALLIREALAFFSGNELVSGIVLCFWLLWTGLGSLIYSRINLKVEPKIKYAILLFLLCLTLFFSFVFIRIAPEVFSLPFGEVIVLDKIVLITLFALCPTCLIIGALFPAGSAIIRPQKVYLMEGIGSFFGGIFLSFIFINFLPPLGILTILLSSLLFAGLLCLNRRKLVFLCVVPLFLLVKINDIELFFRKVQMSGQNLTGVYESRYGAIAITESETQKNIYTSGFFDFAYPDIYSAEEAVHYPLLIHKNPENVLLIGGGFGGAIEQILKHKYVNKLVYLELDPKVIEIAKKYVGPVKPDSRLDIVAIDGRYYIKNTQEIFDCIIINLPDPINAQLNRYYTKEFFQEAKKKLNANGVFCIRVNYSPDILSPIYAQFLGSINHTLKQVFQNVYILPVAKATYIAREHPIQGRITDILKEEIHNRNLNLTYVNDYFFDYNLTDERIEHIESRIAQSKPYTNTDLKPVCYYFNTVLWGGVISHDLKNLFVRLFKLPPIIFFLPLILVVLFWHRRLVIYFSVFSVGATSISAEIILLVLFQVCYGYVYYWLGIIIGLFMLGLASGTFSYMKIRSAHLILIANTHCLSNIQFFIGLYFLVILLIAVAKLPGVNYFIASLTFLGGFLGGFHFPLTIEILGNERAGIIYGVDLLGASLSAIITAIIFIPIIGIIYTLLVFVLLNILVSIGLRLTDKQHFGSLLTSGAF